MATVFTAVKCPHCGAMLEIEEGIDQCYCSYCGGKVLIENDNEIIIRHIDEADVIKAETDREVRIEALKREESSYNGFKLIKTVIIGAWLTFILMLLVSAVIVVKKFFSGESIESLSVVFGTYIGLMVILYGGYFIFYELPKLEKAQFIKNSGGIELPRDLFPLRYKNYIQVADALKQKGFTSVTCKNLHDLSVDFGGKTDTIKSIVVNGDEITDSSFVRPVFMPDANIVLYYHGFKENKK